MQEIINKCKCGVYLEANSNRDVYELVEIKIKDINDFDFSQNGHHDDYETEIENEIAKRMIEENSFISLQFYPNTPIGFYTVYGTTIEEVINKAKEILNSLK